MIDHLVLIKFKPEVDTSHRDRVINALRALKASVPTVVDLTVGANFAERGQGYQVGLFVRFKDKAGLATYATHPEHVAVVTDLIKPFVVDTIVADYEA